MFDFTKAQRQTLDLLNKLNLGTHQKMGDPEITARIEAYEMAYRMQARAVSSPGARFPTGKSPEIQVADPTKVPPREPAQQPACAPSDAGNTMWHRSAPPTLHGEAMGEGSAGETPQDPGSRVIPGEPR